MAEKIKQLKKQKGEKDIEIKKLQEKINSRFG